MTVFLFIREKEKNTKVSFSNYSEKLMKLSVEVDYITPADTASYLRRNLPHTIVVEKETLENYPQIKKDIKSVETADEIPIVVFSNKAFNTNEFAIQEMNIFSFIKPPLNEESINMMYKIAELHKNYTYARENIFVDEVSGLYNRKIFHLRCDEAIAASWRHKDSLSIVLFDIDYFKSMTEAYPKYIQSQIIKHIANIIGGSVRKEDFVARLSDDRFALLISESEKGAESAVRRILATINESEIDVENHKVAINLTAGIAIYKEEIQDDVDVFLNLAEIALLYAKGKKRRGFAFSTEVVDISDGGDEFGE